MIEKLIASMIPLAMQKLAAIPEQDKHAVVSMVSVLCDNYLAGDRAGFDRLLAHFSFPGDNGNWRAQFSNAMWHDENKA